ncbi:hypothetical protein BKA64DRAFT_175018 [Cadophora sp. MPI-SDFR-AT-0126]|nr:hypothetical protein BKA64DRAFT_175018 [Leotiomycetes sp. MPI-SDFR-AT-0126]
MRAVELRRRTVFIPKVLSLFLLILRAISKLKYNDRICICNVHLIFRLLSQLTSSQLNSSLTSLPHHTDITKHCDHHSLIQPPNLAPPLSSQLSVSLLDLLHCTKITHVQIIHIYPR